MIGTTNSSGGGGAGSDECTLTLQDVPKGLKAVTKDSDDEAMEGKLDTNTTASDSQVLTGQTYFKYNSSSKHWEKCTGKQANNPSPSAALNCGQSKSIPAGFNPGGTVTANSLASQTPGNLNAANMASGTYGISNGARVEGNVKDWRGTPAPIDAIRIANGRFEVAVPYGIHGYNWVGNSYEYMSFAQVSAAIGLTANMLRKGASVLDMIGTFEGYATNPLYLYSYGSFGGGQTGVSCGEGAYLREDYIYSTSRASDNTGGHVKFNNTISTVGYNYLNVVGYASNKYGHGTVRLSNIKGEKISEKTICDGNNMSTSKLNISSLSEMCFLSLYADSYYTSSDHGSMLRIYQVFLSET